MNRALLKELLKGSRWVLLAIIVLSIIVASWYGVAWSLGWYTHKFFDLKKSGPWNYVQFGSCILVFTLIIQIITIILTGWFLFSWGKSRNINQKEKDA